MCERPQQTPLTPGNLREHHHAADRAHAPQVKALVERAYRRAKDCISSNINILHDVAGVLAEKENIDGDEFQQIILKSKARQYLKDDAPDVKIPYQEQGSPQLA